MKTLWFALLLLLPTAPGTSAELFSTNINPALLYYQAFLLTPELESADRDFLWVTNYGRGDLLPERFGRLMSLYDHQFTVVCRAASASVPCDWGLDPNTGPATLMPHLARTKAVAQAARLRALWHLQQGNPAQARQELIAALVLGRNVARSGLIISALVQTATEAIICSFIAENFSRFPDAELKLLLANLDSAPPRMTLAGALPAEKAFFQDWMLRTVTRLRQEEPGDDAAVMEGVRCVVEPLNPANPGAADTWKTIHVASGGTSEGLLRLLEDRDKTHERVGSALALPWSERARLAAVSEELGKSPNPLVASTLPSIIKARNREFKIDVWFAMIRAAIEYKLHGTDGFNRVSDPCGTGPFPMERFLLNGADRGFLLRSAYDGSGFPEALIFVESDGPRFRVDGPFLGKPYASETDAEKFRKRYGLTPEKN